MVIFWHSTLDHCFDGTMPITLYIVFPEATGSTDLVPIPLDPLTTEVGLPSDDSALGSVSDSILDAHSSSSGTKWITSRLLTSFNNLINDWSIETILIIDCVDQGMEAWNFSSKSGR